jgi:hypothetical protein
MSLDRQLTTFYVKAQSGKGSEATMDGSEAIEITYDSSALPLKPMANNVTRNNIRNSRLPQATIPVGKWGETPNPIGAELHGSGAAGTAPEYGLLLKNLLGSETVVPSTSVTYAIASAGDSSWLTVHSFVGDAADTAVKVAGVDARCRAWGLSAAAGEIVNQTFGIKSLTATESDTNDPNTPTIDGQAPMVASGMTFTIGGGARDCKSVEFTVENPKQDNYINTAGIGSMPEDSNLTISGTMTLVAESDEEFTKYFASTLSDIVLVATDGTETCTITLTSCQYDNPDPGDSDGTVEYSVPFIATGGVTVAFT